MRKNRVAADDYTVTALLTTAATYRKVSIEEVQAMVAHFEAAGIARNEYTCTALVQCVRVLDGIAPERRVALMRDEQHFMLQRRAPPPPEFLNSCMEVLWEAQRIEDALEIYRSFGRWGARPNEMTMYIMQYMLVELGRLEEAADFQAAGARAAKRSAEWRQSVGRGEARPQKGTGSLA